MLSVAHRLLGISTWDVAKIVAAPAASVLIMVAVLLALAGSQVEPANVILKLAMMVSVGAMVYLAAMCLINAQSVGRLAGFIFAGVLNRNRTR
jgi:hypothetical protein